MGFFTYEIEDRVHSLPETLEIVEACNYAKEECASYSFILLGTALPMTVLGGEFSYFATGSCFSTIPLPVGTIFGQPMHYMTVGFIAGTVMAAGAIVAANALAYIINFAVGSIFNLIYPDVLSDSAEIHDINPTVLDYRSAIFEYAPEASVRTSDNYKNIIFNGTPINVEKAMKFSGDEIVNFLNEYSGLSVLSPWYTENKNKLITKFLTHQHNDGDTSTMGDYHFWPAAVLIASNEEQQQEAIV